MHIRANSRLLAFFLFFFLFAAETVAGNGMLKIRTVVIDPGHGGNAPGCVSRTGLKEKDVTLSVALRLGRLIKEEYPEIKVLYTRTDDRSVGLDDRSSFANRNKADLFISIHVNATGSSQARGSETWVMGTEKAASNLEVCKAENSVITLEEDYSSKYSGFDPKNPESYIIFSLLQNTHLEQSLKLAALVQKNMKLGPIVKDRGVKQGPFLVLWKTTMPSILIELGFMSNPTDLKLLSNRYNHNTFAKRIFAAFREYKEDYESMNADISGSVSRQIRSANEVSGETTKEGKNGTFFAIQVFSSSKILKNGSPEFRGLELERTAKGGTYKYTYGRYSTREEADKDLDKVRRKFRDAFIVRLEE